MDIAFEVIESMLVKFRSEKKWTLQAIEQLSDEDKEFERGLELSKEQALNMIKEAFNILIQYLEHLKLNPDLLLSQPFLNLPPLTYSQVNNETTALNLMIAMVREVHYHTGQIIYAAKLRKGQLVWQYD